MISANPFQIILTSLQCQVPEQGLLCLNGLRVFIIPLGGMHRYSIRYATSLSRIIMESEESLPPCSLLASNEIECDGMVWFLYAQKEASTLVPELVRL